MRERKLQAAPTGDERLYRARCLAARLVLILGAFAFASVPAFPADDHPRITVVEDRVWSCEFTSAAVDVPMRFLVVLPAGATRESAPLPTIYFLHGRGRHERTLFENETTRPRVLASPCAVVLPRGRDGWYMDSPAMPDERYAGYVDEVIALAEEHFPVSRTARSRAIGGWSMGGYGAMYTACRRSGDFAAAASVIGLIDFPRLAVGGPEQNYEVPPRFGTDPAVWQKYDPRHLMARLRSTALFVAYADQAVERQMNEAFLADAHAAGFTVETLVLHGGHTFPMVEQGLPPAFSFMEHAVGATPPKP
ncbi:MAG TPA: alpha/beta hydrolase-fold protein [Pirellulales bacterium]|jgi:S-formylglutathione hydrolase FrmB|nr:alpha/beta hydrolase-fold protein [Pirellulales bacterium]